MTVTPVLADQLEDAGARERLRRFLVEWRIGAAEADLAGGAGGVPARPARPSWPATGGRWSCSTRPAATRCGRSSGRRRRGGSRWRPRPRPTRCCRCWRRARGCGCSSTPASARTGAASAGTAASGCRSAPTSPGWSGAWPRHGVALVLRRPERPRGAAARRWPRCATEAGPVALPIDWEAIGWLWSLDGYPSDPAHAQFAGKSLRGVRIWKVGGGAYDPAAAAAAARAPGAASSSPPPPRGCASYAERARPPRPARLRDRHRAARPLVVGGPGLAARRCWPAPRRRGCGCSPCRRRWPSTSRSSAPAAPPRPGARARTSAPGTRPPVADLAWGARRLELRLLRALSGGLRGDAARARRPRAARRAGERLGLPRPARPGRRLRLPAGDRSRPGRCWRP